MSWGVSLPRIVTWARFRQADGEEIWLYNTHFPHRAEDAAARLEAARSWPPTSPSACRRTRG